MKQYSRWAVNCVVAFLSLALVTMFFVADKNNDTIHRYESLIETQKQRYEILSDCYDDLLMENHSLVEYREGENMSVLPTYSYTPEEVLLLAKTAQCEAGAVSESPVAVKYCAKVVLNRVASPEFPDTITEVVYEQKVEGVPQFSVAYNGMIDNCVVTSDTLVAVQEVLLYDTDLPSYVEYFFEESVEGNWVNTLPVYCTVDGTTFAYSERSLKRYGD